jgi:L-ascorbate metabolism protein UlaG (beta-lactamase superfamily)
METNPDTSTGETPMATRLCWLGHSCLLLEHTTSSGARHNILIDPFLDDNPKAPLTAKQVPADFILVSHGHDDHIGEAIPIAQRTGATVISNYEISLWLQAKGLAKVHGMQHGGGSSFPFGRVKLTLAFHGSMMPDGSYGGNPCGFLLSFSDGVKVYNAADTGLFGDMRLIGEEGIDLALLPIGDLYTMGPDDALRAVKMIQPKKVVPIHYSTWPPIDQDAAAWAERVRAETHTTALVPQPGEWIGI